MRQRCMTGSCAYGVSRSSAGMKTACVCMFVGSHDQECTVPHKERYVAQAECSKDTDSWHDQWGCSRGLSLVSASTDACMYKQGLLQSVLTYGWADCIRTLDCCSTCRWQRTLLLLVWARCHSWMTLTAHQMQPHATFSYQQTSWRPKGHRHPSFS